MEEEAIEVVVVADEEEKGEGLIQRQDRGTKYLKKERDRRKEMQLQLRNHKLLKLR